MNNNIEKIFRYFSFFSYSPTFEEIYTFYPKNITKKELKKILLNLERKKKIILLKINLPSLYNQKKLTFYRYLYTVGEYSMKNVKTQTITIKNKYIASQNKLSSWRFRLYTKLLSFFPQIKLIGLSGSMAMMNAKEEDDIDLFIITSKNRLFVGRFIAIFLAKLLAIHRRYQNINKLRESESYKIKRLKKPIDYKNKVCLNLFFDESNMEVPNFKKTKFVAHEILQMKPIINKDKIYTSFLKANQWVFHLFPNSIAKTKSKSLKLYIKNKNKFFGFLRLIVSLFGDGIESLLKRIQFFFINRHRTTEIITSTQLWFHPNDFEKKIKNK